MIWVAQFKLLVTEKGVHHEIKTLVAPKLLRKLDQSILDRLYFPLGRPAPLTKGAAFSPTTAKTQQDNG